ncbi:MAG TPA: M56 family metallopeptidase, partial [Tepidisphaeraceae bacterium]
MNWQAMGSTALRWALWNTAGAGVVFVVILIVLKAVGNRLSARARHNLWMLVALRLVLPAIPGMGLTLPRWPRPVVDAKTLPISYQTPSDSRAIVPPFTASVVNAPESVTTEEPPVLASVVSASQVAPAPESSDLAPLPAATDSISGPVAVSNHDQSSVTPTLAKDTRVTSIPKAPNAIPWRMWLMLMWLSGAAIAGSWLLGKIVQLWLVTRVLEPVKDQIALELIEECRVLVGLKRPPALVVGSPDFGPALVGFWRPRLFVPANVLSTFGRQELRVIFLHELVHQRRRDVAINYLIAGLQALHWFNPLVWMAFSKLRAERELACDEAVLKLCASRDRLSYGCTILKLLESACGNAGLAAGAVGVIGNQALIHRRIDMIARFDRSRQGRSAAAVVLSIIVGAAALGATSQAQDKPAALPPPNGASAGDRSMDSARATIEAAAKPAISANQSPVAEDPKGAARPEVGPVSPAVARPDRGIGNLEPDAPLTETAARPSALDPTRVMPPNVPSMRAGRANQPAMGMDASPRIIEDASAAIADAKTAERLKHTHPMKVDGVPLRDMLNMIAEIGKVDIVTDNQALADAVDPNVAVTMNLNEPRPLEQILEMSLRLASPKIDYSILNGVLFVSSRAQLNQRVVTRVYEVGGADHSTLNDLLINGTGLVPRVSYVGDKLVITASELTQRHVAKLLSAVADQMSRKIAGQAANRGDGSKRTTVYGLH